jgi:hypothetical protein
MGKKINKTIPRVTNAVANAINTVVNSAAEVVVDVLETVGNVIEDGSNVTTAWVAKSIPGVGGAIANGLRWMGRVSSAAFDLGGAIVKGAAGVFAGVLGGTVRILAGIVSLDRDLAVEGAIDVGSGIGGAALLTGGKAIAFVQTVAVIQAPERQLSGEEVTLLKRVFHNSVALYNVRLVEGRSGLFGINDRPFTLGNTIYLKDRSTAEQPELLVHECIHVWQYQHMGARYTMDAVGAQKWYEWFTDGSAYDWKSEFVRGKTNWLDLNREAQGRLFQEVYVVGSLWDLEADLELSSGGGVFYDADGAKTAGKFPKPPRDDFTRLASRAADTVRGVPGFRLSRAIG